MKEKNMHNKTDQKRREMELTRENWNELNENETEGSGVSFDKTTLTSKLPGPSNFHCTFPKKKILNCSWEIKTDLAQYISYTLSYTTHSTALAEWRCVEKIEVMKTGGLLRMVGLFHIFEPGVLQVRLSPTPVTRVIRAYEHIQPARPTGLSVNLQKEDWVLNWTLPKYRTVPLSSELQYWSILTPEDLKIISLSDPVTSFSIPEHSLMGSIEYRARVRCSIRKPRHSGQRYAGYYSGWTDAVSWTTRSESLTPRLIAFFLYFLIAALSAAVSIIVFFILFFTQRRLRDWNASLPSPVHSKVSEVRPHPQKDLLVSCRELKAPNISSAQIVDALPQFSLFDTECTTMADANHGSQSTVLHIDDSLRLSEQCTFGNVMGIKLTRCDGALPSHTFSHGDVVLQCLEGYMQNPETTTDTIQNALQEVCHRNGEINGGYMNCLKPDLISAQGTRNTYFIHI